MDLEKRLKGLRSIPFSSAANKHQQPKILLALDGGGSHGAFTAGALKALQENDILENVVAVTGTSAGAVQAACVGYGLNIGDSAKSVELVNRFWDGVKDAGSASDDFFRASRTAHTMASFMNPYVRAVQFPNLPEQVVKSFRHTAIMTSAAGIYSQAGDIEQRMKSVIPDWEPVQKGSVKVVVGGALIVGGNPGAYDFEAYDFEGEEIDPKAIAASATLIGTTQIGDKKFMDGAYVKNPPVANVLADGEYTDILAIKLSREPIAIVPEHEDNLVPEEELMHAESYSHIAWEIKRGRHNVHAITMDHEDHWNETSKMNTSPQWIEHLEQQGYETAMHWIAENKHLLGVRTSYTPNIVDAPAQRLIQKLRGGFGRNSGQGLDHAVPA